MEELVILGCCTPTLTLEPLADWVSSAEPTELGVHASAATLRQWSPKAEPVQRGSLGSDKFTTEAFLLE